MTQQQSIGLKSVGNARELGGYRIGDRRIRRGLLLRSARLSGASDEDIQILSDTYRLGAVADLRMTVEQEEHPDRPIPGAVHYALPVMEFVEEGLSPDMAAFVDPNTDRVEWIQNAGDLGFLNDRFYIDFLRPEMGRSAWRKFFQILLDLPGDRAILWHCTDGKDRTGVAAMLLLSALGADRDLILRDYLLTNSFNADKLETGRRALSGIPLSQSLFSIPARAGCAADFSPDEAFCRRNTGCISRQNNEVWRKICRADRVRRDTKQALRSGGKSTCSARRAACSPGSWRML